MSKPAPVKPGKLGAIGRDRKKTHSFGSNSLKSSAGEELSRHVVDLIAFKWRSFADLQKRGMRGEVFSVRRKL
ncbi:MAG TPA: hypothetical protein DDX19_08140 [Rhodopirellula baltica]|nr:hypothetical protein [Rhodopirellula baltica]